MKTLEEKKESARISRIKYRENNKEKVRQSRLDYNKRNPEYMKRKRETNYKNMLKKYRWKQQARWTLRKAVSSGRIKKLPCEICGEIKSQGHHPDYAKPLEVLWLCQFHHNVVHGKITKS